MPKRHSAVLAAFSAVAVFALPCLAASHTRYATGNPHAALAHASVSHMAGAHASMSRFAVSRAARGTHTERAERSAPVHHDMTPAMDPDRATAIQTALIRRGYLSGQPSGVWDADSVAAMQKLQDANGWQTKYTPDSRALLKLGLGGAPVVPSTPAPVSETAAIVPAAQP